MAQMKTRLRKELPNDPIFRAGYDQGYLDVSSAILTFMEEKFMNPPEGVNEERDGTDTKYFLDSIRELSAALKAERNKADARVNS